MPRTKPLSEAFILPQAGPALTVALVVANMIFNIAANASFKVSATSTSWRGFLFWQVVGNLAGLVTVLTLTALLRYIPLHVAFPVTTALAIFGVQVVAASLLFHEAIPPARWLGTILMVVGIALMGGR